MIKGITKIEFNSKGFKEILMSDGTQSLVQGIADNIRDNANANNARDGEGFTSKTIKGGYGGGRWIGFAMTTDHDSLLAESEDKALTKAVHS